jgi:hypothetical protein
VFSALEQRAAGTDDLLHRSVEIFAVREPQADVGRNALGLRAGVEREHLTSAKPDEDELVTDPKRLLRAERGSIEGESALDVVHVDVDVIEAGGPSHYADGRKISLAITSR